MPNRLIYLLILFFLCTQSSAQHFSAVDSPNNPIVTVNIEDYWTGVTWIDYNNDGVKDLNIKVYEYDDLLEKWNLVSEDTSDQIYAVTTVKPEVSAMYKVEVIVEEFYEGYTAARYGLIFVHD